VCIGDRDGSADFQNEVLRIRIDHRSIGNSCLLPLENILRLKARGCTLNLKYLPIGDDAPHVVNAIVEIPKGSRNKYEYNIELGVFQLDRVLFSSMHYPEAYGFIPSTLYDDGDPVDVLIVIDQPLQTGIMIEVKPIGILKMADEKGSDDKIISVAKHDPTYSSIREVKELPKHTLIQRTRRKTCTEFWMARCQGSSSGNSTRGESFCENRAPEISKL
jgi:inorganic pyrophosphatase